MRNNQRLTFAWCQLPVLGQAGHLAGPPFWLSSMSQTVPKLKTTIILLLQQPVIIVVDHISHISGDWRGSAGGSCCGSLGWLQSRGGCVASSCLAADAGCCWGPQLRLSAAMPTDAPSVWPHRVVAGAKNIALEVTWFHYIAFPAVEVRQQESSYSRGRELDSTS